MRNKELTLKKLYHLQGQMKNLEVLVSRNQIDESKEFISNTIKENIEEIIEFISREEEN